MTSPFYRPDPQDGFDQFESEQRANAEFNEWLREQDPNACPIPQIDANEDFPL